MNGPERILIIEGLDLAVDAYGTDPEEEAQGVVRALNDNLLIKFPGSPALIWNEETTRVRYVAEDENPYPQTGTTTEEAGGD